MSEHGRAVVVLMAHPDDEFAISPWIESALQDGRDVTCVWLTDGGWGGQCVATRRRESEMALSRMGLDRSKLHFAGESLSIADGELHQRLDDATAWLRAHFGATADQYELWLPAWEGGHQDHDATHLAGLALARGSGALVRQYPLYQGKGLAGPWFRVLAPLAENGPTRALPVGVAGRMRSLVRCFAYRSQWKSFAGLLPFMALRMLGRQPFAMQDVRWERTAEPPHGGALLYERRHGPSWQSFATATRLYRAPDAG